MTKNVAIVLLAAFLVGLLLLAGLALLYVAGMGPLRGLAEGIGLGDRGAPWMMGRGGRGMMPWETAVDVDSLEEAEQAFAGYLRDLGYDDLAVADVMEFEHNYYAIAVEEDTGIGAMELLLDKDDGLVGPEYGPNMMWNERYGMHAGGMMRRRGDGEMVLPPEEAVAVAQDWLDQYMPGASAGEADPFYGYYTLHFARDGRVEGMLSVHGESGEVWYHDWHGALIRMTEHAD